MAGDRTLAPAELSALGTSLLLQAHARRFVNPVKRYVDGIQKRYRAFRKVRQDEGRWYAKAGFEVRELNPLELDLVLLAILRSAGELLQRPTVMRDIDSPAWASLKPVLERPAQPWSSSMRPPTSRRSTGLHGGTGAPALAVVLRLRRLQPAADHLGARSADELQWVFADFDIRRVTVSLPESPAQRTGPGHHRVCRWLRPRGHPARRGQQRGRTPVLLEYASLEDAVGWLAARIQWIDRFLDGRLPSSDLRQLGSRSRTGGQTR